MMNNTMEKYKVLIDLLKHQDSQINSFLTWNVVIQGGLLVALKLDAIVKSKSLLIGLHCLGIIFVIFWILSGVRLKLYTDYYIKRLKELEDGSNGLQDFHLFKDGEKEFKRGVSKSLYLKWIPLLLGLAWFVMLVSELAPDACTWWLCYITRFWNLVKISCSRLIT